MRSIALVSSLLCLVGTVFAQTYDADYSMHTLHYAAAAYCDYYSIQDWQCGPACTKNYGLQTPVSMFSDFVGGTQGYAGYNPSRNEIAVSFRGSQDLANWYDNIDYFQKQYPGGPAGAMIHIGFYDSYMTMSSQVLSAVTKLVQQHPTATIIVTGHSLGAAQSTFAAMDIKLNIKPSNPMKVYNYGSPRTGNQAFTDFVYNYFPDGSFWRVIHKADPVPHLPLTEMGFNHAGNEAFYNDDSHPLSYQLCKSQKGQPENHNCADIYYVYTPNDHLMYLGVEINNECTSSSVAFPAAFLA